MRRTSRPAQLKLRKLSRHFNGLVRQSPKLGGPLSGGEAYSWRVLSWKALNDLTNPTNTEANRVSDGRSIAADLFGGRMTTSTKSPSGRFLFTVVG
jgi:hypothetical protein